MADELSSNHPDLLETPEGYADAIRDMASELAEADADIDQRISELEQFIERSDPEILLEKISIGLFLSAHISTQPLSEDGVGIAPSLSKYLIGKIISHDTYGTESPDYYEIAKIAVRIQEAYTFETLSEIDPEAMSEEEKADHALQYMLRTRELTSDKFMYHAQASEAARRAYSPHNTQLKSAVGFEIEDAQLFVNYLGKIYSIVVNDYLEDKSDVDFSTAFSGKDQIESLVAEFEKSGTVSKPSEREKLKEDSAALENIFESLGDTLDKLWLSEELLFEKLPEEWDEDTFQSFLNRMSYEMYSEQSDFSKIDEYNPLEGRPIISRGGSYLVPHPMILRRSLVESFFYDLIQLEGYGDPSGESGGRFGDIWGDYIEDWGYDSLLMGFPDNCVFQNPDYKTESGVWEEAADILVVYKGYLLVFECKSKKLVLSARGGEVQSAKDDLAKGIGEASSQANNFIEILRDSGEVTLRTNDGIQTIDYENIKSCYPCVVMGEQYDGISVQLYQSVLEFDRDPYVVSVYDLQIICDLLEGLEIVGYISKRPRFTGENDAQAFDEIDVLGYYVNNDHQFADVPEGRWLQIMDYSRDVARRLGFKYGP